jgi:hypothetical protein
MNPVPKYLIRFDTMEAADAGRAAESLRRALHEVDPAIEARRVRTDPNAMDFGSALEIVLAAPAFIELARGIANWLARSHTSKVTIIAQDGTAIVENIGARDAVNLAEKLEARYGRR